MEQKTIVLSFGDPSLALSGSVKANGHQYAGAIFDLTGVWAYRSVDTNYGSNTPSTSGRKPSP